MTFFLNVSPLSEESITVGNSIETLTPPVNSAWAIIICTAGSIRYNYTKNPTSGTGFILLENKAITIYSISVINSLKMIDNAGTPNPSEVEVAYFDNNLNFDVES